MKGWYYPRVALSMSDDPEDPAEATGLEKVYSHPNSKKGSAKECSNHRTVLVISLASKVMLKILHARLQHYVNQELPEVLTGFRKGRGTRDQIANICWIVEKAREYQKNICFVDCAKVFDCVDHNKLWKALKRGGNTRPSYLSPEKPVCESRSTSSHPVWNN